MGNDEDMQFKIYHMFLTFFYYGQESFQPKTTFYSRSVQRLRLQHFASFYISSTHFKHIFCIHFIKKIKSILELSE